MNKARQTIKEGRQLLEERQKMIRLADRSDYGWELVSEYEADELADDSDDEKRITTAEKAAEQRLIKKRKTSANQRGRTASVKWSRDSPPVWRAAPPIRGSGIMPVTTDRTGLLSNVGARMPRPAGPCFSCGEFGHIRSSCSKIGSSSASHGVGTSRTLYPLCSSNSSQLLISEVNTVGGGEEVVLVDPVRWWEAEGKGLKVANAEYGSVKGRLHNHLDYWESVVQAPAPIISIVKQGYILPFVTVPENKMLSNQSSVYMHEEFVTQAVLELVQNRCVRVLHDPPKVCSPLLVVVNRAGKKRLVLNLRYVNRFLWKEKFKYEDIRTGLFFFERGELLCTFDLKSGYHHVDIHNESQAYLGFQWKGKYYAFTVMPFGLSTACYVFTKLLRPLVRLWRGRGIKVVMYIDDGVVVCPGRQRAVKDSTFVQESLQAAGFLINQEKSQWEPSCRGRWLGFEIDLHEGILTIPEEKSVFTILCESVFLFDFFITLSSMTLSSMTLAS